MNCLHDDDDDDDDNIDIILKNINEKLICNSEYTSDKEYLKSKQLQLQEKDAYGQVNVNDLIENYYCDSSDFDYCTLTFEDDKYDKEEDVTTCEITIDDDDDENTIRLDNIVGVYIYYDCSKADDGSSFCESILELKCNGHILKSWQHSTCCESKHHIFRV